MDGTVLIADDDRTIRTVLTQALTRAGCKVHATSSLTTLMRWVEEGKGDLVISDVVMPDGDGIQTLPRIAAKRPGLPVIVISAQNTIMTAIRAAEKDAYDYLPKPFDLPDLLRRAARGLSTKRRAAPTDPAPEPRRGGDDLPLVGRTRAMQDIYRLVARVMNTDLPVVIVGESGTGKSLIARALHDFSDRRALPFLTVGAADFGLLDVPTTVPARAHGGTVLFDGIGDFDEYAQGGAVRMMDTAEESRPRFLATSLSDLGRDLDSGRIRRDLFGRLSGLTIALPPLRERVDDIPLLAEYFLDRAGRGGTPPRRLSDEAAELIRIHSWPGNVRQLENTMRRLAVTSKGETIERGEVDEALGGQSASGFPVGGVDSGWLSAAVHAHLLRHFDMHRGALPPPGLRRRVLKEVERPLIELSLDVTGGNQARCAELLGINRNTLRKKITELDIRVTRRRELT